MRPVPPAQLRIVIVDDEPTVRVTLGRAIARQPDMAVVGEAAEGGAALSLIDETAPDVVVMDVTMPGISGVDVVRGLRAAGDRTPVLFLTGDVGAIEGTRDIECSRVLLKAAGGVRETLDALRQVGGL